MTRFTYFLLLLLLLASSLTYGQQNEVAVGYSDKDDTKVEVRQYIQFENDSRKDEILLSVPKNTIKLKLFVSGQIDKGSLMVELFDPNNKKVGNFSLSALVKSDRKSGAMGNITKSVSDPFEGNWTVKVIPKDVTGYLEVRANYYQ